MTNMTNMTNFKVIDNTNFMALSEAEMMETEGGFVVTGTMIYTGVKLASASFALGYAIGQAIKNSK